MTSKSDEENEFKPNEPHVNNEFEFKLNIELSNEKKEPDPDHCPICLGEFESKSLLNVCLRMFFF